MAVGDSSETAVVFISNDSLHPGGRWNTYIKVAEGDDSDRAVKAATSYVKLAVSRGVAVSNVDASRFGDAVVPPMDESEHERFDTIVQLAAALATNHLVQTLAEMRA